jgi:hypothetical protein
MGATAAITLERCPDILPARSNGPDLPDGFIAREGL